MKLSRSLGLLATLGVCWLSAVGCDDGTNTPADGNDASSETGGSAGKGTGGSAGKGTGGTAGKGTGGSSGSAAAAGAGGSGGAPAGTGGSAGKGGGAGGSSAGAGGTGTGGAGGGTAGADGGTVDASVDGGGTPDAAEAGRDGSHGGTGAKACTYHCETDDDCLVDGDATQKCHPTKKRCMDPATACETNDDCVGFVSFWTPSCAADADCFPGDVCVDAGGYGLCATPPDPIDGCFFPGTEPMTRKRFGAGDGGTPDGGAIAVCGATSGRCTDGRCINGCSSDPEFCTNPGGFGETCNEGSGLCECAASSECTTSGVSACNQQKHLCECATNADCISPGLDTCVAGSCGCSSASACPTSPYKNAVSVCD